MAKKIELLIIGDSRSAERALNRAGSAASRFGGVARKAAGITAAAGATLLTLGGYAAKAAVDFESSFAGVRKTVDASEPELKKLADGFLNLSRRLPVNVNALNAIGEAAGQLGIQKRAILKFTETIAKLGVSTNLAGEEGAAMLARFANVTRMPQGQFDRLGATIVALGNAGASTETEIAEMGLRLAAAGSQVGMTQPQILGLANALSSVGIEAEAGGSAMSTAMISIEKSVQSGGKKLELFAATAGMSAEDFARKWKANPSEALIDFVEGLDRVKREGGNVFKTLDELGLGGIRVRDALLRSAGAGDLMRKSLKLGNKAWKENIALNKEAERRFKTTASQLQLLKNNVQSYAIVWGAKLLPAINGAILKAGEFVRKFAAASGFEAKLNVVWTGVQEVGRAVTAKLGAAIAMVDWTAVWSKAQGIGAGLQAKFAATNWTSVGKAMGDGIATGVGSVGEIGKKLADSVMEASRTIDWVALGRVMGPGLAAAMATAFVTLLDPGFWAKNWDLALAVALAVFGRGIGKLVAPLGRMIGTTLTAAWERGILAIVGAIERRLSPRLATAVMSGLLKLPGLVTSLLGRVASIVTAQFAKLGRLAQFVVKVLGIQVAIDAVAAFAGKVNEWLTKVDGWFKSLPGKIKGAFPNPRAILSGIGTAIISGLWGGLERKWREVAGWLGGLGGQIKGLKGPKAKDALLLVEEGRAIIGGLGSGMAAEWVRVASFLRGLSAASLKEINSLQRQLDAISARRESQDRAAAVRQAEAALAEARKKKEGVAAAELALARAREDIVVAGLTKQLAKEQALYDKRQTMIQSKMDRLNAAVQKAQDKMASTFDRMQDKIMRAFDASRGGMMTPAEAQLAAISDRRRNDDLQRALRDARESGDAEAIARAEEDIQVASLERQAANERRAMDQQTEAMREKLTDRLAAMSSTWKGGTDKILGLLNGYGIDFANVGALLGDAFRESLLAAIAGSSRAAAAVGSAKANVAAAAKTKPLKVPYMASGGHVLSSGLAFVHRGESVVPAGRGGGGVTINVSLPNYLGSKREVAQELRAELIKIGRGNVDIFGGLA